MCKFLQFVLEKVCGQDGDGQFRYLMVREIVYRGGRVVSIDIFIEYDWSYVLQLRLDY